MRLLTILIFIVVPHILTAQAPIVDWVFHPDYQLPGRAANHPGPRKHMPVSRLQSFTSLPAPLTLREQQPTHRLINLLGRDSLPDGPFSMEAWLVNHVNQPIGALMSIRTAEGPAKLVLGGYGRTLLGGLEDTSGELQLIESTLSRGWKKYWLHLVITYDGEQLTLYFNGVEKGRIPMERHAFPEDAFLEIAAYLENEPYMETANLLRRFRLFDYSLTGKNIEDHARELKALVEKGVLYEDLFHFTAGPYLHYATPTNINISWETDRPLSNARIEYGTALPLETSVSLLSSDRLQTATLKGLQPGTTYFYRVVVTDSSDTRIDSGVLTFATAPASEDVPFTFAVIGDTEARPHINFQVGKLVWDERPNFLINLGDLTDGGQQAHKFEWNYEYFAGVTPLCSRIPVFPVAGNGESDLYWYKKYHELPEKEAYYSFRYGNAAFFMLNSNDRDAFAPGGEQYVWLEEKLKASTAQWKFVSHHHAPYSVDEDDYGNSWEGPSELGDIKVRKIVPLYEKYGVDMVFFGHLHTYQRSLPILNNKIDKKNGLIYMQGGGAGGNLEDFAPTRAWFSGKTYRGHHYFIIDIVQQELQLKMYDSEGRLKDFLTIEK